jgi:hypothetical protein
MKKQKQDSFTISFRLEASYLMELEKRAALKKTSVHDLARRLLMDALNNAHQEETKEQLSGVRSDIDGLRLCLADVAEALLITAGGYPKEQAREWTTANIREQ